MFILFLSTIFQLLRSLKLSSYLLLTCRNVEHCIVTVACFFLVLYSVWDMSGVLQLFYGLIFTDGDECEIGSKENEPEWLKYETLFK